MTRVKHKRRTKKTVRKNSATVIRSEHDAWSHMEKVGNRLVDTDGTIHQARAAGTVVRHVAREMLHQLGEGIHMNRRRSATLAKPAKRPTRVKNPGGVYDRHIGMQIRAAEKDLSGKAKALASRIATALTTGAKCGITPEEGAWLVKALARAGWPTVANRWAKYLERVK